MKSIETELILFLFFFFDQFFNSNSIEDRAIVNVFDDGDDDDGDGDV